MRQSVTLRQQLGAAIEQEIADRVTQHQAVIAQMKTTPTATEPLVLLAVGDSWFDYPLSGNTLTLGTTDIIAQLTGLGTPKPVIVNLAHYGEASTDQMSLPKQQRIIQTLQNPANWLQRGKPDAILFSAGGDDIVGDQFCIFVGNKAIGDSGLSATRFTDALGMIRASYSDLFAFRDMFAPGVPVFAHCYDYPLPTGTPAACLGPWLKPSLDFTGWNYDEGRAICHDALLKFRAMLQELAADAANLFTLVDTQGTLADADWANELHPYPAGFTKLAERVFASLQVIFPGRI